MSAPPGSSLQISVEEAVARLLAARVGGNLPEGGKHILIACMPKSASTFLHQAIANIPGIVNVTLTVGYHRREQELCPLECTLVHELDYVAAHHVRYSKATDLLLRKFKIFPVILMRNVFDCIVSMREHLLNETLDIQQAYVPRQLSALPIEHQYDFIIDFVVPWYASFFASWSEYEGNAVRLLYSNVIRDIPGTIAEILDAVGIKVSTAVVEHAISSVDPKQARFNVGKIGRGIEQLSEKQIGRIQSLFSYYSDISGVENILYPKSRSPGD